MRLILPGLAVLLLTACGLKNDLYLPEQELVEPDQMIAPESSQDENNDEGQDGGDDNAPNA